MKRRWFLLATLVMPCNLLLVVAQSPPAAKPGSPTGNPAPVTDQQIEADWLRQEAVRNNGIQGGKITPEEDAKGGCDGIKTGRWGFHTENEPNPWWQVDLGKSVAVDRIVLYNRTDLAERNSRIKVILSSDGKTFQQVYQHDGGVFYGFSDKKPLVVSLKGAQARFVRLQLPGTSYFHLDEVEIYPPGQGRNIALNRPATQSSTSTWSAHHATGPQDQSFSTAQAIKSGLLLADNLRAKGVAVDDEVRTLQACAERLKTQPAHASAAVRKQLYLDVRWAVRRLALRNPLLDFDALLFAKAAPGRFPHMSDQFYGWWSRPGGGIFILEGIRKWIDSRPLFVRCLTSDMPEGSYLRPDLSYDGKKVLFAYCRYYPHVPEIRDKATKANLPEDSFYHIFEMNLDGTGRRQLTRGRYDDFDARYLPSGEIVFLSTRKGTFLQCSRANTGTTATADLPDSYVRCGGDNYRPVPVFTLHVMDRNGGDLRPMSAFENFEWTPAVANDGTVLYTRWDYIDRFNGHFFSLWSTNPDGTNPLLVYGNFTVRPQVACEARPIPQSQKLIMVACAHHSILGGSLALLDRKFGQEGEAPLTRLTPEVPFPETEANVGCYYDSPWPLSEDHYLVGWADKQLPPHCRVDNTEQNPANAMGVYLYDRFGNLNLLYRDPDISSNNPIPVKARPTPPVIASSIAWSGRQEGAMLVQDIYQGLTGPQGESVARGTVKALRVIGVPPKVQPHMNNPNLGVSSEDPGKFLLGSVPVEKDGSAYFRVPSGIPLFFQALDAEGLAIQTMRSLTYVGPQQTLACVGCHERRETAPPIDRGLPLALRRGPSRLQAGPQGSWPLRFDRLVQPVLDKSCTSCHRPGSGDVQAARFDLTAARSYDNLLAYADGDLKRLAFEKDRSLVNDCPARQSKLLALLRNGQGHKGVRLDADSINRLATWMDLYAHRQGHFSPQQEKELHALQEQLRPLLAP